MNTQELLIVVADKIKFGNNLVFQLDGMNKIEGVMKLQRKIRQELEFLKKLQKSKEVKVEQLCCSNLRHLGAMVKCTERPGVVAVCKVFHIDVENKLIVDIISDEGRTWTKVVARNPKSLSTLSSGNSSYGSRSILDQAIDYLKCAQLYPCMYQPPKVVFEFFCGIEETLAHRLKSLGVVLKGEILPDSRQYDSYQGSNNSEDEVDETLSRESASIPLSNLHDNSLSANEYPELCTLNLDVTAMMAYVSNMTNGNCNYIFKQEVLTQQSLWESKRPVKPILDNLFTDKKLVCCHTAWTNFEKIVNTLGGPLEKQRTAELETRLTILPDDFGGEDDFPRRNLKVRGNVRLRSKIIFNFGHRIKALTVSANEGFVRAARQQGVTYAAFVHESRALTEGKEESATKICS